MRSWDISVTGIQEKPFSAPENPRLKQNKNEYKWL